MLAAYASLLANVKLTALASELTIWLMKCLGVISNMYLPLYDVDGMVRLFNHI